MCQWILSSIYRYRYVDTSTYSSTMAMSFILVSNFTFGSFYNIFKLKTMQEFLKQIHDKSCKIFHFLYIIIQQYKDSQMKKKIHFTRHNSKPDMKGTMRHTVFVHFSHQLFFQPKEFHRKGNRLFCNFFVCSL
jgi:hypothetical protein